MMTAESQHAAGFRFLLMTQKTGKSISSASFTSANFIDNKGRRKKSFMDGDNYSATKQPFNYVESIKSSDPMSDADNADETKNDIEFLNDLNQLIQKKEKERKSSYFGKHLMGLSAPAK